MLNRRSRNELWLIAVVCTAVLGLGIASAPTIAQEVADPSDGVPLSWKGSAGVVVSVVDERGGPLPDAEVSLRLGEGQERLVLRTDENGRAEVTGLAGGEWQVDVQREGFMLFNAYVLLESGKKPKVAFSSRQRTGTYWEPLKAVFLPPGVKLGRGVASGRESVKQAQSRAEKATKETLRQQRRAQRAANKGRLARVVPSEPVEPTITDLVERREPEPEPAVAADVLEAPRPKEAGLPSTQVPSAAEESVAALSLPVASPPMPVRDRERAVAPAPKPEPESVVAEPTSDVETILDLAEEIPTRSDVEPATMTSRTPVLDQPLTPVPSLLRNPNLRPAGACPECGAGEFSVEARGQAEKFERGDTCSLARLDQVSALAPRLNSVLSEGLGAFAGSLAASNGNDVLRLVPPSLRSDMKGALSDPSKQCQVVGVVLPAGARYVGFRYQAGERSVMAECPQDGEPGGPQDCQVGDARWLGPPSVVRTDGVTLVLGVFDNRSRRSTRLPQLVVYFQPQRGWLPPSR